MRRIALLLALLACPVAARAAEPRLLDVDVSRVAVRGVESIRVVPRGGGQPLVEPNGQTLFGESPCKVEWKMTPAPGGFDIAFTLTNPTDKPAKRLGFMLRGIQLSRDAERITQPCE
ncbi:MAG: hypothetical protein BIFFINMI_01810 [Phycisphaerae bacterium]|nr:hypothetical protein [Phycisphaerae bacterium]